MRTAWIVAIVFAAGALGAAGLVHAQTDADPGRPAAGAAPGAPVPVQPATQAPQRMTPRTDSPPARGSPATAPGAATLRAQFDASMSRVDSGLLGLGASLGRTVRDLKGLAFMRVPSNPKGVMEQRRLLDARVRDLMADQQRLASIERILNRWRAGAVASPQESAIMVRNVQRRSNRISIRRRQLECGRYFAGAAGRALATRGAARPTIPPGC